MSMIDYYGGEMLGGEMLGGSSWTDHVKAYRAKHPNLSYKEALQKASATYKGKGKKTAKKTATKRKAKKGKVEDVIKALVKGKKTATKRKVRASPTHQKAVDNAMYLRERLFPVANSKNKKMKITMEHLKKLGFNTKAMTKDEKKMLSKYLADQLHGRGIGADVGNVVDDVFGFGGMALGGYPMGCGMLGKGIGADVGSAVDEIFGFGRKAHHPRAHHPRAHHKRGGFSLGNLAPLAALAFL